MKKHQVENDNKIVKSFNYIRNGVAYIVNVLGISFIECVILVLSLFGSIVVICSDLDDSWQGKLMTFVLTFISSWILSKISSNRELKEEQKKFAIISYRHGKNLSAKMDLSSEKYNYVYAHDCSKKESCIYFKNMNDIIEDLLIFKNDTEENIEDFSRYIGNDIIRLEKVEEFDIKLSLLNSKLQDENYNDKIDEINKEIKDIEIKRQSEFGEVNKELQVHYMKRKKRNQDLEKIIKNRRDVMESIKNDTLVSEKLASAFKDLYEFRTTKKNESQN